MTVDKRNIFLRNTADVTPYVGKSTRGESHYPNRDVATHARLIQAKLQSAYQTAVTQKQAAAIRYKEGVYLEFSGAPECDLAINRIENMQQGIRLLNVRVDSVSNTMKATVYIPAGKESYFINKVTAYANEQTKTGKPKNDELIKSIEDIKVAILDSFWIGEKADMPGWTPVWCELWLQYDYSAQNPENWKITEMDFLEICHQHQIRVDDHSILFPERIVKLVLANEEQLKRLIEICSYVAEIRRAQEAVAFFTELPNTEQQEWMAELLARTHFENSQEHVAICLLDTGLTASHDLLQEAIQDNGVHAVHSPWGTGDHQGHGTEMAGIALYNDLKQAMEQSGDIFIPQKLESVKILPPRGENPCELYGAITEQAVSIAELSNPNIKRILCMAVTSPKYNTLDGSPTSWSAAIDSITSGADEESEKRLFFISAGNVYPNELVQSSYPDANTLHQVESPGQAWNAVTVGGYSQTVAISDPAYADYTPVADAGELSPYSSTSELWSAKWPIKPEILLDGGNMATNGFDYTECPDLSLLTTNYRPLLKQFSTIWGTSSASAQAAWMGAQLLAEYPHAWPETIRGLLIHSAQWTDNMKRQFCSEDSKTKGRRRLLRTCGYGIPNLQRAIQCMNNSINLIIQGEFQPFHKGGMNEMHFHSLPWPKEQLRSLGEIPVTLKVNVIVFYRAWSWGSGLEKQVQISVLRSQI